jgi:hypothetical protein
MRILLPWAKVDRSWGGIYYRKAYEDSFMPLIPVRIEHIAHRNFYTWSITNEGIKDIVGHSRNLQDAMIICDEQLKKLGYKLLPSSMKVML